MTKGRNMATTCVFWNIEDYPILKGLNPTAVYKITKSALENQGYYGDLLFKAYCDEKNWENLYHYYCNAGIRLLATWDFLTKVDNMLVDILVWGIENPIPSNLMIISNNNISEETELFGVLEDLKSDHYNILVAQFEEDASSSTSGFVRLSTSLFDGGNQKERSHGVFVFNRERLEAKIGVFWNMEDCQIPEGIDPDKIYQNVKSALANQGCHGEVSIWAYCDKNNNLSLANVTLVPAGDKSAIFKKMFKDIIFWARQNRVRYPSIIPDLMVISKISGNTVFTNVLKFLNREYNVLLTLPDVGEYISDVWLYPCLSGKANPIDQTLTGIRNPIDQRDISNEPKTCLFWNIEDCPIPKGLNFYTVDYNFKSAIRNHDGYGEVLIKAYWDYTTFHLDTTEHNMISVVFGNHQESKHGEVSLAKATWKYKSTGLNNLYFRTFTLQKRVKEDEDLSVEVDTMFSDILLWAMDNPAPSNLMVISKNISQETELLSLLQDLDSRGYNILVAHAEEAASSTVLPFSVSFEWVLKTLFSGGSPITTSTFFQGVRNNEENKIQMESSLKRKKLHEANTAVFWNIEDCPMPGGLDTRMFLQNIKSALRNHSCHGNVSITAYYDNNRSLDDFSLTDNITLVHSGDKYARITKMLKDTLFWALENPKTSSVLVIARNIPDNVCDVLDALSLIDYNFLLADPHNVSYVNNVWLSTSLFRGENPIDQSIIRNFPKQIGA